MLCFDNFQRGVSLLNQRGEHSSSLFKGTHQCGHQVHYFDDDTYDAIYVDFTQHNQSIPSPWGMPDFSDFDLLDVAGFFCNWETYEVVTAPDFSGESVESYIRWKDVSKYLTYIQRAFPARDEDEKSPFDQCPCSFNRTVLNLFLGCCH